jgi:hypothetical protein
MEVNSLLDLQNQTALKHIIINHDDHKPLLFHTVGPCEWKQLNHKLSVENVIEQMIDSGEIDNLVVQENNLVSTRAEDNYSRVMEDYKMTILTNLCRKNLMFLQWAPDVQLKMLLKAVSLLV